MPKAPGRNERNGISVLQLFQMFPDDRQGSGSRSCAGPKAGTAGTV